MKRDKVKLNPNSVLVKDIIAIVRYAKVTRTYKDFNGHCVEVTDIDTKKPFRVIGTDLIKEMLSADFVCKTKKVTRTELAQILSTSYNRPFTVCFDTTQKKDRTIRGRLVHPEPLMGRSMIEDLDTTSGSPIKQVDHRTLHWMIVDGVRYEVKG